MHQKGITDKWLENELTRWWLVDLRVSVEYSLPVLEMDRAVDKADQRVSEEHAVLKLGREMGPTKWLAAFRVVVGYF